MCKVFKNNDMHDGDGTTEGSCNSGFLCYADGNCKGMISAFILIILIGNYNSNLISIFISPIYIFKMILMIAECITNSSCSEDKPFCISGFCKGTQKMKDRYIRHAYICFLFEVNTRSIHSIKIYDSRMFD